MEIGKKIALCRKEAGMSQEALAAELGISRQAVSRWETGEAVPDTENIINLSRIFSVTTDYLLLDEVQQSRRYDPENSILSVSPVIERRRRFRIVFGVVMSILGSTFISASLIFAVFAAEKLTQWWTAWGRFGTALFTSWLIVPLICGIILLIAGGISLLREYLRED